MSTVEPILVTSLPEREQLQVEFGAHHSSDAGHRYDKFVDGVTAEEIGAVGVDVPVHMIGGWAQRLQPASDAGGGRMSEQRRQHLLTIDSDEAADIEILDGGRLIWTIVGNDVFELCPGINVDLEVHTA